MSNLLPGENLVIKAHPHWIVLIKSVWIPIVAVVLVVIADFTILLDNYNSWNLPPRFRTFFTLGVVALAGLWLIVVWIRWQSTAYTLTDQRIKIETGVFGRQEKIIPIDRVQDCTTKMSLLGRMPAQPRRVPRPGLHALRKEAWGGSGGSTPSRCQSKRRLIPQGKSPWPSSGSWVRARASWARWWPGAQEPRFSTWTR
jgi:membrane protein YdbS with pleckstrin-like domain